MTTYAEHNGKHVEIAGMRWLIRPRDRGDIYLVEFTFEIVTVHSSDDVSYTERSQGRALVGNDDVSMYGYSCPGGPLGEFVRSEIMKAARAEIALMCPP